MHRYARTLKYLISCGVRRDRALLTVARAFALTPEQIVILDRLAA